jgi:hypothetical protein
MAHRPENGWPSQPLIGTPCARDESQRHHGLPVFIQNQTCGLASLLSRPAEYERKLSQVDLG